MNAYLAHYSDLSPQCAKWMTQIGFQMMNKIKEYKQSAAYDKVSTINDFLLQL